MERIWDVSEVYCWLWSEDRLPSRIFRSTMLWKSLFDDFGGFWWELKVGIYWLVSKVRGVWEVSLIWSPKVFSEAKIHREIDSKVNSRLLTPWSEDNYETEKLRLDQRIKYKPCLLMWWGNLERIRSGGTIASRFGTHKYLGWDRLWELMSWFSFFFQNWRR